MASWDVAPVLRVRDVRRSVAYYRDCLGFDCPDDAVMDGGGDEGAIYAILRRDGVMVHLGRARTEHEIDPGRPPNAIGVYLFVEDVKPLFDDFRRRGAEVVSEPCVMSYGLEEIVVRDLDGYYLSFGAPA